MTQLKKMPVKIEKMVGKMVEETLKVNRMETEVMRFEKLIIK